MSIDINKQQVDIENLFKQNENDLSAIKELYKRIEELGEKITQIKYIDSTLVKKIKKEYESLKKQILDENVVLQLDNKIDEIKSQLDNKINESKNEINSQLDSIENNVKEINISKMDGSTPEEKLKKAIEKLENGGTVILDINVDLTEPLHLNRGVNIISTNKNKITRCFDKNVSGIAIYMKGKNKIDGIIYDGGSSKISVTGNDYIYYEDLTDVHEGNCIISNVEFINSCGSFITNSTNNLIVENCTFGEYLDHCVYIGGRSYENKYSNNIVIRNNYINTKESGRQVFKIRNGATNVTIENNYVVSNGWFISIDILNGTDSQAELRENENIYIRNNCATVCRFLLMSNEDLYTKNLFVENNDIKCSDVCFCIGDYPTTFQNGCSVENLYINNNKIYSESNKEVFRFNGLINGGLKNVNVNNNHINYNNNVFVSLLGNTNNINFMSNNICLNKQEFSYNNLLIMNFADNYIQYKPTVVGNINFENNSINGFYWSLLSQNLSTSSLPNIYNNVYIKNNSFHIKGNFKIINVTNDTNNLITTKCEVIKNNIDCKGDVYLPEYPNSLFTSDMINIKNSTAGDIDSLKNDFNNLLMKLKTLNIIY